MKTIRVVAAVIRSEDDVLVVDAIEQNVLVVDAIEQDIRQKKKPSENEPP